MNLTRQLLVTILAQPLGLRWSLQGFGMLRLYISHTERLHVWAPGAHAVPDVSTIHDHPWDFESHVLSGKITNRVYRECVGEDYFGPATHYEQLVQCGEGDCAVRCGREVRLEVESERTYTAGETYSMTCRQFHESLPEDGTITVIRRTMREMRSSDHATVYAPFGYPWVSAEPRKPTDEEVLAITRRALELWK